MAKENVVRDKSFDFSLKIIALYKELINQREFVISKQLLRSATSIGANIEEASAAQSKRDFLYKMSISSKEARESRYWLKLLKHGKLADINVDQHLADSDELVNILTSIVKTTEESLAK